MGVLCLEVKLPAMWERSKRERISVCCALMAWNNHILSLHSRLAASINLGDACNLPCFKLRDQEHLLKLYTVTHCSPKQLRSLALFSFSTDIKEKGDEIDLTSMLRDTRAPLQQQAGRDGKRFWFKETGEKGTTASGVLCVTHDLFQLQAQVPFIGVSRPGPTASPLALAEGPLLNISLSGGGHISSKAVVILCLSVAFPKC